MKTVNIRGKEYPFFLSAKSELDFGKMAAQESDDMEMLDFSAGVVHQCIKDGLLGESLMKRLVVRIPSKRLIMRSLNSQQLMQLITGSNEVDPN